MDVSCRSIVNFCHDDSAQLFMSQNIDNSSSLFPYQNSAYIPCLLHSHNVSSSLRPSISETSKNSKRSIQIKTFLLT
jgi:CRISPR/Cas system CSM-associated protein Csm4 (group 5 of RAMP superfamily)